MENKQSGGQQECVRLGHDMANTVDKVESLFRKAESDLEYMSRKLEDEFREQLGGSNHQMNPSEMMQRLQRVRTEYNGLVRDAAGIQVMQSEMTAYFKTQLQVACSAIKALQEKAPEAPTTVDSSEQEEVVESLIGMRLESSGAAASTDGCGEGGNRNENSAEESSVRTKTSSEIVPPGLSQAERRAKSDSLIAISEEEFQSVSPLVRGRSKLADVNSVYRVLFEHYKETRNTESLTVQEMTKKGMRITGATGEAKLKVLRVLKILNISKSGAVTLL